MQIVSSQICRLQRFSYDCFHACKETGKIKVNCEVQVVQILLSKRSVWSEWKTCSFQNTLDLPDFNHFTYFRWSMFQCTPTTINDETCYGIIYNHHFMGSWSVHECVYEQVCMHVCMCVCGVAGEGGVCANVLVILHPLSSKADMEGTHTGVQKWAIQSIQLFSSQYTHTHTHTHT